MAEPLVQKLALLKWKLLSDFEKLYIPRYRLYSCRIDQSRGLHRSASSKPNIEFNSDFPPNQFLGFSNRGKGAPMKEISK